MPITLPWYRAMRAPEKTSKITMPLNYMFDVGDVMDVSGTLVIVVGIEHEVGVFASTTAEVVEPNWWWRVKYKCKRFLRRLFRPVIRTWNRLRHGNPYG